MLPTHMAALQGFTVCLKRLILCLSSFDINTADDLGRTCLHAAACGGWVHSLLIFEKFYSAVNLVYIYISIYISQACLAHSVKLSYLLYYIIYLGLTIFSPIY